MDSKRSFSAIAMSGRKAMVYLIHGTDAGKEAWYYVLIDKIKINLFLRVLEFPHIELERYGKILFSGYGQNPPVEITHKINNMFS